MNKLELEKGEILVTNQVGLSGEGFIVSLKGHEDDEFILHIKIRIDTGDIYNIVFPLKRLRHFKGII